MRLLLLLVLLVSPALVRADDVKFVRVWPGYKGVNDFKRISEYFTGKENTGSLRVERSRPDSRDGYYFVVRVANKQPPMDGSKFVLKVITPDSPFPREFTFPANLPKGQTVYELGLTGTDWSGRHAHPVAWRLELFAGDGKTLVAKDSFLWGTPDS